MSDTTWGVMTQDLPPTEDLLSPGSGRFLLICYDLEATGLQAEDEMIQIGAFCSSEVSTFSCYILPQHRLVHVEAEGMIGLRVQVEPDGRRTLNDTRQDAILPAVDERTGLLSFLEWLEAAREHWDGVVLVSHGAIFLDIPLLVTAVQRHQLNQQFFEVVKGFCDTFGIFSGVPVKMNRSLQSLYTNIVGPRDENHRAPGDAKDLHVLLRKYYHTESLSLSIGPLARFTYSSQCMVQYVKWKEVSERCKGQLAHIVQDWKTKGTKKKNVLVKNLLAAGYNYETLEAEYKSLGTIEFKTNLTQKLNSMKRSHESYLTDTKHVSTETVVKRVVKYFDERATVNQSKTT